MKAKMNETASFDEPCNLNDRSASQLDVSDSKSLHLPQPIMSLGHVRKTSHDKSCHSIQQFLIESSFASSDDNSGYAHKYRFPQIKSPKDSDKSTPLQLKTQESVELSRPRAGMKHKHLASLVNEQIAAMKPVPV